MNQLANSKDYDYPVKQIIREIENLNNCKVLQISGNPVFSLKTLTNNFENNADYAGILGYLSNKVQSLTWWKPNKKHNYLKSLDEAALRWLFENGYTDKSFNLKVKTKRNMLGFRRLPGVHLSVLNEGNSSIILASDENGKLSRQLSSNLSGINDNSYYALERVFALFHEAAHKVFSDSKEHFQPLIKIDKRATKIYNLYMKLNMFQPSKIKSAFAEIFADTYGAMMLLHATNFDDNTIKFLQDIALARIAIKDSYGAKDGFSKNKFDPHVSGDSLLAMMSKKEIEKLKTLAPSELRKNAFEWSSDYLLSFVCIENHSSLSKTGIDPNSALIQTMSLSPTLQQVLDLMGVIWLNKNDPYKIFDGIENNDLINCCKEAFKLIKPSLEKKFPERKEVSMENVLADFIKIASVVGLVNKEEKKLSDKFQAFKDIKNEYNRIMFKNEEILKGELIHLKNNYNLQLESDSLLENKVENKVNRENTFGK